MAVHNPFELQQLGMQQLYERQQYERYHQEMLRNPYARNMVDGMALNSAVVPCEPKRDRRLLLLTS